MFKDGKFKIADFGFAKLSTNSLSTVLGTPLYTAP